MLQRLTIRIEPQQLALLKQQALAQQMRLGAYTRYLLSQALLGNFEQDEAPQPNEKVQRLLVKSNVQILSLARLLASEKSSEAIEQAIAESNEVVAHLYGEDEA